MTNQELLEAVSTNKVVARDVDSIREEVEVAQRLVQKSIHRKVKGYWLKENDSFTLGDTDHTVDLINEFPDLLEVRFFWTATGAIDIKPERWFRTMYPAPTGTGTPTIAVWLTGQIFRFHPIPSSDTTIYVSYFYVPDYNDIAAFPEQFHDIVLYGVLSHFEDNPTKENSFTRGKYTAMFEQALEEMSDNSGPTGQWEPELIYNESQGDINEVMGGLERT